MKAVYIHIPFCNNICSYCDFPKLFYNKVWINKYLDSLEKEIKKRYKNELIETIYIGGGTPTSLNIDELKKLFNIIKLINSNYKEFTIECNLDSLTKEKIDLFKENKINRVSIGIESFDKKNLLFLNRKVCNLEMIDYLKDIGITNINVDLIYAIPKETKRTLINDLDKILELDVTHISTYSLIIEPHTVLYNNKIKNIDEEKDYEMYNIICSKLKNYKHYEISNFSKEGFESKHNLTYWNNENYYGFGLGASGYINDVRYTNTKSINNYIDGLYDYEKDQISAKINMENEMILGLRKLNGVSISGFLKKYNQKIEQAFDIDKLLKEGKLIIEKDYIKIPKEYLYTSNNILINFIGD